MYFFKLFLSLFSICMYDSKFIKNIDVVSCRNCIHYKLDFYNDYNSDSNKCIYFGTKNIQTSIIDYEQAISCRSDETKCGLNGLYFQENPNIELKIFINNLIKNIPLNITLL